MFTEESGFFVSGGTLRPDAPCYVERPADQALFEVLWEGRFCYVLTARQMGKSSLMVRTAQRLKEDGIAVASLDLTSLGVNVTEEQWYFGLLEMLGKRLRLRRELEACWEANARLGAVTRWMQAVEEVVLRARSEPVVIFIDEIDAVLSLPFSTDAFFAAIRECYNRRAQEPEFARLTFCLLGVAAPSDLIRDTRTTPFNIGSRIELEDFTEAEALPLARGLCRDERTNTLLLRRVLAWTNGHPYLTQRLCTALSADRSARAVEDVDRLCIALFLSVEARERDDNLLFVRERLLRSECDPAAILSLYEKIARGNPVRDEPANPLVGLLRLSGIVAAQAGVLRVRNRIYARVFDREWIRESMPDAEMRRRRAAYRQGLLRASLASAGIIAVVGGLAIANYRSARRADRNALRADKERNRADKERNLAVVREKEAQAARVQANDAAVEAVHQRGIAQQAETAAKRLAAQRADVLHSLRAEKDVADKNARDRNREAGVANAKAAESHRALYIADMNLAQQAWENGDVGRVQQILDATRNDPMRGFEWDYWQHQCRLERKRFTFAQGVGSVQYSPDGKSLLVMMDDCSVRLLDIATGRSRLLCGPQQIIMNPEFSSDGSRIAVGRDVDRIEVLEVKSGRPLFSVAHSWVKFVPGGKPLAVILAGDYLKIADGWTRRILRTLNEKQSLPRINALVFSSDGKQLAASNSTQTFVWDVDTGQLLRRISHCGYAIAFFPDNRRLLTGPKDGVINIVDITTGKLVGTRPEQEDGMNGICCLSPDGTKIAGSSDKTAGLWDVKTGKRLQVLKGHTWRVASIAFSPDGKTLATGSSDATVRLWDLTAREEPYELSRIGGPVNAAAISPDGKWFVTGNESGEVTRWDVETGYEQKTFVYSGPIHSYIQGGKVRYVGPQVRAVCISPDGKRSAAASDGGWVQVRDRQTGQEQLRLCFGVAVRALCFTPDGNTLVTGDSDHLIKLWNVPRSGGLHITSQETHCFRGHTGTVLSVCVSPDGKRLLTAAEDHTARVWDMATGRQLLLLRGHTDGVTCAHFSHDGKHIVTGSWDDSVRVWNARTGQWELTIQGHVTGVLSACFSPDDRRILTGGNDKTAKLWDAKTGRELLTLRGHSSRVTYADFSPDGKRIVTASYDGSARVWFASPPASSVSSALPSMTSTR